ncbi:MAG: hypothetical protein K9M96_08985 [Deltaproteobacteria bacterium]|nr:hypothetical protein [Deltaproteobacteria bacterium]
MAGLVIIAVLRLRDTHKGTVCRSISTVSTESQLNAYISIAFFALLILSAITFICLVVLNPHGGWDACGIWNLRARHIFRSGINWKEAFSNVLEWTHPDYPLLIPLSTVRIWLYSGRESVVSSAVITGVFTFATVGMLVCALGVRKDKSQGYLAGLMLLGIPFFIKLGADQYADVPVAFFFLATVILCTLYLADDRREPGFLFMGGITGSFAAWTKNEGLMFMVVVPVAFFITRLFLEKRRNVARELTFFTLGALPVLLVLIYFKVMIAPENDLLGVMNFDLIRSRITDLSRYATVSFFFLSQMWAFWQWNIIPILLLIYLIVMKSLITKRSFTAGLFPIFTVLLMGLGYFFVYITMSKDLLWHLDTSFSRLLIQLTPTILFAYFLIVPTVNELFVSLYDTPFDDPGKNHKRQFPLPSEHSRGALASI